MKYFLILTLVAQALAQTKFDYKTPNTNWCSLGEKCCGGQLQSPLDIKTVTTNSEEGAAGGAGGEATNRAVYEIMSPGWTHSLDRQDTEARSLLSWSGGYHDDQQGTLSNVGNTIQFKPFSTSEVITGGPLGNRQFKLINYNFHWPSEHYLDGIQFAGEIHLVHQNILDENDLAIVAFLLRDSGSNTKRSAWLDQIVNPGYNVYKWKSSVDITLNLNGLFGEAPDMTNYAYYQGSLTTPSCDENVDWIVMLTPVEIKQAQLTSFTKYMDFNDNLIETNNRPIQSGQTREVKIIQEV